MFIPQSITGPDSYRQIIAINEPSNSIITIYITDKQTPLYLSHHYNPCTANGAGALQLICNLNTINFVKVTSTCFTI